MHIILSVAKNISSSSGIMIRTYEDALKIVLNGGVGFKLNSVFPQFIDLFTEEHYEINWGAKLRV